ncbi:MAG: uroporphyrinogen decarboxylase family protein [Desulfarculaceae bacterium]|jgi:uroporphyrinogen decarboxylase
MTSKMSKSERVRAALSIEEPDRIPISIWLHYPHKDQDPRGLAEYQVEAMRQFDYDFIKLMPFGLYTVQDWGCQIKIFCTPHEPAVVEKYGVQCLEDWESLEELSADYGTWGKQLQLARHVGKLLQGEAPFIQTIFSPLTTARKLAGDRIFKDLKEATDILHQALGVITATTINFVKANIEAGVSGFFFATQCACTDLMTSEEHNEFGKKYDLEVFDSFVDATFFNVLHLHGDNVMFQDLLDYPANCLNWHDRWVQPSLGQARKMTAKCLMGGINEKEVLAKETPQIISRHVEEAVRDAGKKGLILGPGCVADPKTPATNYYAARLSAERF